MNASPASPLPGPPELGAPAASLEEGPGKPGLLGSPSCSPEQLTSWGFLPGGGGVHSTQRKTGSAAADGPTEGKTSPQVGMCTRTPPSWQVRAVRETKAELFWVYPETAG